jgi:hypothetical protein
MGERETRTGKVPGFEAGRLGAGPRQPVVHNNPTQTRIWTRCQRHTTGDATVRLEGKDSGRNQHSVLQFAQLPAKAGDVFNDTSKTEVTRQADGRDADRSKRGRCGGPAILMLEFIHRNPSIAKGCGILEKHRFS